MKRLMVMKYAAFSVAFLALIVNTVMMCLLTVRVSEDRKALQTLHSSIHELKEKVDTEIRLREELFPKLKKSARLLQQYNGRLDFATALTYAAKILECSDQHLPADILTAMIVVESGANYRAVSSKGALGLTQVMPNIWRHDRRTLFDPYRNIEIGSTILKKYIERHGLQGGLSAYNSGRKNGSPHYARKVLRIATNYF